MSGSTSTIQVTISAVDKATKTILQVNKMIGQMTKSSIQLSNSLKNFSKATGLDKVGKQFLGVGRAVSRVGGQIKRAVERTAEFVGISSVAAIAAIATEWGKLGFEIQRSANMLNVSTDTLQGWRGAAVGAGLEANDATSAFKNMGTTIEDAINGRNNGALGVMMKMGVGLDSIKSRVPNVTKAMMDLSRAITSPAFHNNRFAQGKAAGMFGAEGLLPLLLAGPEAIQKAMAESRKTGYDDPAMIERAAKFGGVLFRAKMAAEGLSFTIGDKLIPVFQPLLDKFISWEESNKDVIATKIGDFVQNLAIEIPKLAKDVDDVVQSFGGWKTVAIGLGIVLASNVLAPTILLGVELGKLAVSLIPPAIRMFGALAIAVDAYAASVVAANIAGKGSILANIGVGIAGFGALGLAGAAGYGTGWLLNNAPRLFGGQQLSTDVVDMLMKPLDFNKGRGGLAGSKPPPGGYPSEDVMEAQFEAILGKPAPASSAQSAKDIYNNGSNAPRIDIHVHGLPTGASVTAGGNARVATAPATSGP